MRGTAYFKSESVAKRFCAQIKEHFDDVLICYAYANPYSSADGWLVRWISLPPTEENK